MISFCLTSAVEYQQEDKQKHLEQCIVAVATHNTDKLEELYQLTRVSVYGFILSILKNTQDAEDILQDTYIQIYHAADKYAPHGTPMAWIFTIARNLSLMRLRQKKKTDFLSEQDLENSLIYTAAVTVEDKMVLSAVMQTLSDQERQIIMLHAVAGFKHREIADILQLALPTVLSKYNRGIKKLRQRLTKED